jgi:hypothetical protein
MVDRRSFEEAKQLLHVSSFSRESSLKKLIDAVNSCRVIRNGVRQNVLCQLSEESYDYFVKLALAVAVANDEVSVPLLASNKELPWNGYHY